MYMRTLIFNHLRTPIFPLPSVTDAPTFVSLLRRQAPKVCEIMRNRRLAANAHLRSRYFDEEVRLWALESCRAFQTLSEKDVEEYVQEKNELRNERLVTCLVPYRLAANFILSRLPEEIRSESIEELKWEEESISKKNTLKPVTNQWIQWQEMDVYVSTGKEYIRRLNSPLKNRIPIFTIMGHVGHGKTTLLDALQGSGVAQSEAHSITQSIRAFTIPNASFSNEFITFLDTPGHRVFAEMRFHAQLVSDFVILVVSLAEGVQGQAYEIVKVALNLDRPIIVVLNKADIFSNRLDVHGASARILGDLAKAGLDVTLVWNTDDILRATTGSRQTSSEGSIVPASTKNEALYFGNLKKVDPGFLGSRTKPRLDLRRSCLGICLSATTGLNLRLLWELLHACTSANSPQCQSNTVSWHNHPCCVQAVVLESSKHLFDADNFKRNRTRRGLQYRTDLAKLKDEVRTSKKSVYSRFSSTAAASGKSGGKAGGSSSNVLVLNVIVREGVVSKGMAFIADQSKGSVDYILDYWGNKMERALPGMAVTLVDMHSNSGCPGAGIHVLSMPSIKEAEKVFHYRRYLQWYVEIFPQKLSLLRPRGMDTSFFYLGNYGQLDTKSSLQSQVVFGVPPKALNEAISADETEDYSIAKYLSYKNGEERCNPMYFLPEGTKNLSQSIARRSEEDSLNEYWQQLRPDPEQIKNIEAYEKLVKSGMQVGVLLKVDTWHSARMLTREISLLSTRKIFFQVIGVRFGELTEEEVAHYGAAVKIFVCYRTPLAGSRHLDQYIESNDSWLIQTDLFSNVLFFIKWCAVALHRESYLADANAASELKERSFFILEKKDESPDHASKRRTKLLVTQYRPEEE